MDHFRGTGGTERHLASLISGLPQTHFQCRLAVMDLAPNRWVDQIKRGGVPVDHVPIAREYAPAVLPRLVQLSRIIRSNQTDIVQTFHQKSDTVGAFVARLSGVRHIVSSKRDTGEMKKGRHYFLNRRLRNLFERVIVVADAIGEIVVAKEHIPRSKIVRIYNGVDAAAFAPPTPQQRREARERLGFSDADLVLGMVARFRREKSHDIFFAGALAAAARKRSLKVMAIGGGPLLEQFRARYAREVREGQIRILDDCDEVVRYLHAMDIGCLLPSSNEGFSNSVLEKMAVGLPLIVTNVGGNAEAVLDRQNGLVIPARDVGAFRDALVTIFSDPPSMLKMGQRSRQLVEEKFTLERMCAAHESLYRSLVESPSLATP
jgi:glycosyltransferase involved in cell wall biosynthesis